MSDDDKTIDIAATAASFAKDMLGPQPAGATAAEPESEPEAAPAPEKPPEPEKTSIQGVPDKAPPATPEPRKPPSSWAKEHHERWGKLDADTQAYIDLRERQMADGVKAVSGDVSFGRAMREATEPFKDLIAQQGVDAPRAVQFLLNAHAMLTRAAGPEAKREVLARLAKSYGIDLGAGDKTDLYAESADPQYRALQERLNGIEGALTAREQAAKQEAGSRMSKEVDAFAADPAHPYFDEVTNDMVPFIKDGMSLKDAYDRAVWANPVTRTKEQAKSAEAVEKKLRENARLDALPKKNASSANVRSRDTQTAPTEPAGTMEDTMRKTLREIKSRTH